MTERNGLTREEVMVKIGKLLALTTSSNEAEASLAMERAAALMEKYSLTLEECQTKEDVHDSIRTVEVPGRTEKKVKWEGSLAAGVAICFDCKVVNVTTTYTQPPSWKMVFIGTKADVEMTTYFFKYLRRCIGRTTEVQNPGHGVRFKNTYALGMVTVVYRRLKDMYKKRETFKTSDSLALVPVKKNEVDQHIKNNFGKVKNEARAQFSNRSAWMRGRIAGQKVALNRAVGNGNEQRVLA